MPTLMPTLSVSSDQVEQSSTPSKKNYKVCTVPFCSLNEDRFASLPSVKEFERRNKWFELLQLDRKIKLHRICHGHFDRHDFGPYRINLKRNANILPSKHLPISSTDRRVEPREIPILKPTVLVWSDRVEQSIVKAEPGHDPMSFHEDRIEFIEEDPLACVGQEPLDCETEAKKVKSGESIVSIKINGVGMERSNRTINCQNRISISTSNKHQTFGLFDKKGVCQDPIDEEPKAKKVKYEVFEYL